MPLPTSQNIFLNSISITYRNAIYEGQIDDDKQTRKDFGIVYVAKTHQFICCNNWHNDNLQGECLFYNDHQQYVYGTWINNLPQGFNVFRFGQVLFMAVFNRGKLSKNSKVLIIFEKYNLAAILLVLNDSQQLNDLQMEVFSKAQVFSSEDISNLFRQCHWPRDYFIKNQTLIKYLSHKLTRPPLKYQNTPKSQPKLRLIENKYYRFGFDQGLAIIFDQDFNRISVGSHSKAKLQSVGILFDQKPKPLTPYNKPQQGKIIKITPQHVKSKTPLKNSKQKQQNAPQNLKSNLLTGVNFCNKFFKNPSQNFVSYIQNIISQQSIKKIISGSLTTRRMFEQSLNFSQIQEKNDFSSEVLQRDLKRTDEIAPITHQKQRGQKHDGQKLTGDRLRLQAIKKQIYDSLQKRRKMIEKNIIEQEFSQGLIHKQIVGRNYSHQMETPSRTQKSKSRRRIFQESEKNLQILRDFTPIKSQPSLTPFKAKMKNRIFNGEQSKFSIGGAKNHSYQSYAQNHERHNRRQIFQNQKAQIQSKNAQQHESNNFQSKQSRARLPRSKGKIRDMRNRDSENGKEQSGTLHKVYDRHVTFEERTQFRDSLHASQNMRQTFESGNNLQYVPIDPIQQKQRKRSTQNYSNHKQSIESNHDPSHMPHLMNQNHHYKYQQTQQRMTPKSKYYLEQKSSRNNETRSFINQNQSKRQHYLTPKKISQQYHKHNLKHQNEKQKQNHQHRQLHNFTYQDDTFKQTTLPEEFNSNHLLRQKSAFQEQNKRSAFRNSNQVYLEQLKQKYSPMKPTQTNGNYNREKNYNQKNKTTTYMLPYNEKRSNSKDNYNNSYRVKHMMKKSIEKDISRSPDKYRCYGKNMNNPYIEASPKYSKQGMYMMSYNNYESRHTLSRNEGYDMGSRGGNQRGKFF